MKVIEVGSRVRALNQLVENDAEPDPDAGECETGWVHAEPGDLGDVVDVRNVSAVGHDEDEEPEVAITVRFDKSGTATMCFPEELEAV